MNGWENQEPGSESLPFVLLSDIFEGKEKSMPQTMTLDEKLAIGCKTVELRKAGDKEGYSRLMRTIPLPLNSLTQAI